MKFTGHNAFDDGERDALHEAVPRPETVSRKALAAGENTCQNRRVARLPQFGLHVQCFVWSEAKSFHYICFWIIFEGSLSLSFSRRIFWWSLGFETQRVRIS